MREAFLSQLLHLAEPVGLIWFCLLVLTVALWRKRQRHFALTTGFLTLFITIIGSTRIPVELLGSLERPYAGVTLETLPVADAIVLLGGGASVRRYEVGEVHLSLAGDRLVMAHALFRLGKAPALIISGNASRFDGTVRLESEAVRGLLATWGVPQDAMIPLGANENTYAEALAVRALTAERGWQRILLVTSAKHMRRASATFRAQGLDVVPVPCNFHSTVSTAPQPFSVSVPRHDGFVKTSLWFHEQVGWLMYRQRGWIKE